MYPREHALVSGAAVLLAGLYLGLGAETLALWVVVGTVAGVFIDVDHIPLAMFFNGKVSEGLYWLRHPLRAIRRPRELDASIDPDDDIIPHRMVSHLMVFLALLILLPYHPLVPPLLIGVGAHIAADAAKDFHVSSTWGAASPTFKTYNRVMRYIMADTITREELKEKMDSGEEFTLVNVLSSKQFDQEHIPGSINIPLDQVEEEFPARFDRGDDIVVYCASHSCQASPKAAEKLDSMGFTNVKDYEGGLADWKEEYETESS